MEKIIFLQVLGLDSYAWLVLILLAITAGLLGICLWLARSYTETRHRLHIVTTDSILAYQKINEAMNYIRQDLQNFTHISSKGNEATYKSIEGRLDRIDRALADLQHDLFRK